MQKESPGQGHGVWMHNGKLNGRKTENARQRGSVRCQKPKKSSRKRRIGIIINNVTNLSCLRKGGRSIKKSNKNKKSVILDHHKL